MYMHAKLLEKVKISVRPISVFTQAKTVPMVPLMVIYSSVEKKKIFCFYSDACYIEILK